MYWLTVLKIAHFLHFLLCTSQLAKRCLVCFSWYTVLPAITRVYTRLERILQSSNINNQPLLLAINSHSLSGPVDSVTYMQLPTERASVAAVRASNLGLGRQLLEQTLWPITTSRGSDYCRYMHGPGVDIRHPWIAIAMTTISSTVHSAFSSCTGGSRGGQSGHGPHLKFP